MTAIDRNIATHYTHGGLAEAIAKGLAELRAQSDANAVELLAGVDEFHIGGRPSTRDLADSIGLGDGARVLDVGCGLGGTARLLATSYGCRVSGVDLTPEYVDVGNRLNADLGFGEKIDLVVGNATDLSFEDASFDHATMLHVGMNIADKATLMKEIARVLRPGGKLGVYDVMRTGDGDIVYPVPWSSEASTSFVARPETYATAMQDAGLQVLEIVPKRDVAIKFFEAMKARMAAGGPPPLGLHIVMARDAKEKVGNIAAKIAEGVIAPVQIVATKPA